MRNEIDDSVENEVLVEEATGLTATQRDKLFRYAATLPDASRRKALARGVDYYFVIRNEWPGVGKVLLMYCGFLLALKQFKGARHAMVRKGTEEHVGRIEELVEDKMTSVVSQRKAALLKNKVMAFKGEMIQAKDSGMSLRQMAVWLLKEHKIKVSREYLRRIFNEWNI